MSDEAPNVLIVTFSQTGNTEQVAEAIAGGLKTQGARVRAVALADADPEEAAGCDLVGIGTPVFYYKEPILVRRFIDALPRAGRKPAFTFITHGGNPVNTLRRMQKRLGRRGYTVLGSFSAKGYDTYPMYFRTFREWGHPDADELAQATDFGERLVRETRWFREEHRFALPKYRFVGGKYFLLSLVLQGKQMKKTFPAQRVNEALCTQCGQCMRACPAGAITLDPYPTISDACIWCYQCTRICPEQAFQCDWTDLRKRMNA